MTSEIVVPLASLDYDSGPPVERERFATWLFLAAETMFFAGLFATYFVLKESAQGWIGAAGRLPIASAGLATGVLVASSWTASRAALGRPSRRWICATLALGLLFVALQAREWNELLRSGTTPSSDLFASCFFVLTGAHGAHVVFGLVWLTCIAIRPGPIGARVATLYWHFVDVVWLVLFAVLYLMG